MAIGSQSIGDSDTPEPIRTIDVAGRPELLALAEEVQRAGRPCLLKRGDEEVAMIAPVAPPAPRRRRSRRRTPPVVTQEWFERITNVGVTDGPTDVAENKQKYLAEAYDWRQP